MSAYRGDLGMTCPMSLAGPWLLAISHCLALAALAVDVYAGMFTDSYPPFRLVA